MKRGRPGFSLIEVMVGFIVLMIALLGLAGLTQRYFILNKSNQQLKEATEIARNLFFQLKGSNIPVPTCDAGLTMELASAKNCRWMQEAGLITSDTNITVKYPPRVNSSNCSLDGVIASSSAGQWGNFDVVAANGIVLRQFPATMGACDFSDEHLKTNEYIRYYRTDDGALINTTMITTVVLWRTRDGAWRHTSMSTHPLE